MAVNERVIPVWLDVRMIGVRIYWYERFGELISECCERCIDEGE